MARQRLSWWEQRRGEILRPRLYRSVPDKRGLRMTTLWNTGIQETRGGSGERPRGIKPAHRHGEISCEPSGYGAPLRPFGPSVEMTAARRVRKPAAHNRGGHAFARARKHGTRPPGMHHGHASVAMPPTARRAGAVLNPKRPTGPPPWRCSQATQRRP